MPSTNSTNRNMYVLKKTSGGELILQPNSKTKWIALFFAIMAPLIFTLCWHFRLPTQLCIGLTLLAMFGAIGYGCIHFFTQRFGLYAIFKPSENEVVIRCREPFGKMEEEKISISSVDAVTLMFSRTITTRFKENRPDGRGDREWGNSWDSYILALAVKDGASTKLIECGAKKSLERMGNVISQALQKPFKITDKN